ncbi:hypothetical protein ACEPAI_7182 [Sanghuangporus weigelae]
MAYDDLLAALQKLELQVADLSKDSEQRAVSGAIDHAVSSCKAKEDSYLDLPSVSVASRSSKDGISKQVSIEQLVEFGSHIHTINGLGPQEDPRVKKSPVRDACHDGDKYEPSTLASSRPQEATVAYTRYMHRTDKVIGITSDVYNEDLDPFACALYSPAQLAFFGNFLRSPFAASPAPASNNIGVDPLDLKAHEDSCDCEKCFLMEVALCKDFKEVNPLEPWVAACFLDEE